MDTEKRTSAKMSFRFPLVVATIECSSCLVIVAARAAYVHWDKLWGNVLAINFLAAWIPFVLSILVAFVPDKELKLKSRIVWRSMVIFCGLLYSVILWRQQTLTTLQAAVDQAAILQSAVTQSNNHADEKFSDVQRQVDQLGHKVDGLAPQIGQSISEGFIAAETSMGSASKRTRNQPDDPDLTLLTDSLEEAASLSQWLHGAHKANNKQRTWEAEADRRMNPDGMETQQQIANTETYLWNQQISDYHSLYEGDLKRLKKAILARIDATEDAETGENWSNPGNSAVIFSIETSFEQLVRDYEKELQKKGKIDAHGHPVLHPIQP